jgi:uncharacterized membrane protein YedE/YeeE
MKLGAIHLRYALYGLLLGFVLSRTGFSDFGELHKMFVFSDLRLFLTFAVGVALSMGGFLALTKLKRMPKRPFHPGTVVGGVLFGVGWATTGACPSLVMVQIGEGRYVGAATLAGILVGVLAYAPLHRRFFRWDMGTCSV